MALNYVNGTGPPVFKIMAKAGTAFTENLILNVSNYCKVNDEEDDEIWNQERSSLTLVLREQFKGIVKYFNLEWDAFPNEDAMIVKNVQNALRVGCVVYMQVYKNDNNSTYRIALVPARRRLSRHRGSNPFNKFSPLQFQTVYPVTETDWRDPNAVDYNPGGAEMDGNVSA